MIDYFDNTKPNIIIITDLTEEMTMPKIFGTFKVARELRLAGYEVVVLQHAHIFSIDEILNILSQLISNQTLFVGFNNFFYKQVSGSDNEIPDLKSKIQGMMLPHGKDNNNRLKNHIKSLNPTCKLVLGGPGTNDTNVHNEFDYLIFGYADVSIVNLANHLSRGEPLDKKSYKSIHGPIILTGSKAEGFDFVNSKMEYKSYDCILPGETMPIEISRGCIFKCKFCSYPLNGKDKEDYVKQENLLYEEFIENYQKFQIRRYFFLDDTFNDTISKVQMIYNISKRLPFKLEFWAYVRLDLLAAHPKTVDMIFESGLRGAFFGIESFNKKTANLIGKGLHKNKILHTLRYIKDRWGDSISLHGSFIVGLPFESKESVLNTIGQLNNGSLPLDSYFLLPFRLDQTSKDAGNEFVSEISANPEKFEYKNLKLFDNNKEGSRLLYWENPHMTFTEAVDIAEANNFVGDYKIDGITAFNLAGLGMDLSQILNKKHNEFNWHTVRMLKKRRIKQYKETFYKSLNIIQTQKVHSDDSLREDVQCLTC